MEIVVIGNHENFKECQAQFGVTHHYSLITERGRLNPSFNNSIIFDFNPLDLMEYQNLPGSTVFVNSVFTSLAVLMKDIYRPTIFGFCGLPSFFSREILEVTVSSHKSIQLLEKNCSQLNIKYKIVKDQVGMVTPRIICMIINEAYYAVEENVASRSDIDLAMKLGTNYPFGPFEWCDKIGIKNVHRLLKEVFANTNDERYKICSLLEIEAGK